MKPFIRQLYPHVISIYLGIAMTLSLAEPVSARERVADSNSAARIALLNSLLIGDNSVQRARKTFSLVIWSDGIEEGLTAAEIKLNIEEFRMSFDEKVAFAEGQYGIEYELSTDLAIALGAGLLGELPIGGSAASAIAKSMGKYAKAGLTEIAFGDLTRDQIAQLEAYSKGILFSLSDILGEFDVSYLNADAETANALCDDIAANIGANICGQRDALISQLDARGSNIQVINLVTDIANRLGDVEYTAEERQQDINTLNELITAEIAKTNAIIRNGTDLILEGIDRADELSAARDAVLLRGVVKNGLKLDQLLLFEEARIVAEADRARIAREKALRKAEINDVFVSGKAIAMVLGLFDPELGNATAAIVSASVSISNAVEEYNEVTNTFSEVGGAALTGNLVIAALNLFSAINSGPSPESIIIEQLMIIRRQLTDIQEHLIVIDDKLDAIYRRLVDEFEHINGEINLLSFDLANNTRLSLDTQNIIYRETNAVDSAIFNDSVRPCLGYVVNDIEIDSQEYARCALVIEGHASSVIPTKEVVIDDGESLESYQNKLLGEKVSRSTNALKGLFEERETLESDYDIRGDLLSFSQWYPASIYLSEFILWSGERAEPTFGTVGPAIQKLVQNAASLRDFRLAALDRLSNPVSFFGAPLVIATAQLNGLHVQTARLLNQEIDAAIGTYAQDSGLRITDWIKRHPSEYREQAIHGSGCGVSEGMPSIQIQLYERENDADLGPPIGSEKFVESTSLSYIPNEAQCALLLTGTGRIRLNIRYRGVLPTDEIVNCPFSVIRCIRVRSESWLVNIVVVRGEDEFVARSDIIHTPVDNEFVLGDPETLREPLGCRTADCVYAEMKDDGFRIYVPGNFNDIFFEEVQKTRRIIGGDVIGKIDTANEFGSVSNSVAKETVYISALTRFAFADVLDQSDAIYSVANHEFHYPTVRDVAREMTEPAEVFDIEEFLVDELQLYTAVFASEGASSLADAQRFLTEIVGLVPPTLVEANLAVNEGETTNSLDEPVTVGSSSSGALDLLALVGLLLVGCIRLLLLSPKLYREGSIASYYPDVNGSKVVNNAVGVYPIT